MGGGVEEREAADIDGFNNGALGTSEVIVSHIKAGAKIFEEGSSSSVSSGGGGGGGGGRRRMGLEHRLAMALQKLD